MFFSETTTKLILGILTMYYSQIEISSPVSMRRKEIIDDQTHGTGYSVHKETTLVAIDSSVPCY